VSPAVDVVAEPKRVLFIFWGRRGALSRFALDLARVARNIAGIEPTISISRQNELFAQFRELDVALVPVDTFTYSLGAFTNVGRLRRLRRTLADGIDKRRIDTVIMLMPHIWAPLVTPIVRAMGRRYAIVVHDAVRHPGDHSGWINAWMLRDINNANVVITLSEAVAGRVSATGMLSWRKLYSLFHPDLCYGEPIRPLFPAANSPFRLAFFGRILDYKGLPLLVDAMEMLGEEGLPLQLGVFGEGNLRIVARRLAALKAEVVNGWIPDSAVGAILSRHHAVVLSHTEASQSGVVAAAHGLGLPVIVTPVGGLTEQVRDGVTGIIAAHADAPSLAAAIKELASNRALYNHLCHGIASTREARSMRRFVADLVAHAQIVTNELD
jgi:glycosyltransferase involved in cell wall biosynthesis